VYGMNFINMNELHYKYAYMTFWIGIIIWGFLVVGFFKNKKWI
jgi:magnesium transporter